MDRIELQKLRDLPIEGVAERLGLRVVRHKALCPFHDDHHASLSFSVRRNSYRCFVCGASGGTIDLVMKYLSKDFLDACRWLADEHSIIIENLKLNIESAGRQNFNFPLGYLETTSWNKRHPSGCRAAACNQRDARISIFNIKKYERFFERPWLSAEAKRFLYDERQLDERVVRWCRLTSWRDRQGVPWLQIPYYDREGKLVGVQNRNLVKGGSPRFRFPQGAECTIYNLPVLNLLRPGDSLFITEGCSDCWAMLSAGHKAIAIPSATLLKSKDVEQLSIFNIQFSINFHMFPDRDEPGERLFMQLQQVLPGLVHHQLPPGCKDFSDYYLAGKGKA